MESFKEYKDLNAMTLSRAAVSKSGINPVIKKGIPKLKTDLAGLRARLNAKDDKLALSKQPSFKMKEEKDSRLAKAGVSGFNKAKKTPGHKTKSHIVVAKQGDKIKTIRFGQQGVSGAGSAPKTDKDKARKKSYYARHNAQDSSPDKMSARYWSHKEKW
tara:strand:- start:58 stop:534 length:477 start_codon:yes stop_codon:yes gene_type:complete